MSQKKIWNDAADPFVKSVTYDWLGPYEPTLERQELDGRLTHVTLSFSLEEQVPQDDWQLQIMPAFAPKFHWAPHLTPTDNHIIDQHCFRSPALIVHDERQWLAVIPDLDLLAAGTPVRWYMDMDAGRNMLTLGMSNYKVTEHVLFEKAEGAVYPPGEVRIGFYIMKCDLDSIANPWRPVLAFLWDRWGGKLFRQGAPKVAPLERYVEHTYRWAFENWADSVWQEFELDGVKVGAPAFIVDVSQSPNYPGIPSEREARSIWNQAWFNSLRSAQGLYRYGTSKGNEELVRRALMTKELALAAPLSNGVFPAVIGTEMETLQIDGQTVNRSKGWGTSFWGNSNRNPIHPWGSLRDAPYHVLDMSWTALLMLRWYEELERDERLLAYAEAYAERLLALQDEKGYFPAWLNKSTLEPYEILKDSPETSLSVTFLLKLYEMKKDGKYLTAALKAMDIVMAEVVPDGRWEDFETYWSCCPYGNGRVGSKVPRNNMYKQCNFSIYWTAEALLQCYLATGRQRYVSVGERCMDELLMTQASWQPPYIYVEALGGFGVMNCDGEWNDSRQSLFAELIVRYGIELDRTEYIERGIAALRASFVMMYCPENEKTKIQWEKAHPFFTERDYGFMMENYGHEGATNPEGRGMGRFTIYDWGNGAAAEAYLRMRERYGDVLRERYGQSLSRGEERR
ncbi:hypothetical protein PAE9249_03184 [Paenibacillus sp. CECT 9249]|uniref:glycoside hydrolase family 88 protein n=1 Tax=Paenibacillus sp. CECT 9249 TaxID=2845385 RepID=UPI001E34A759|nr:glycoside hydrolase family 88 protein [Paenibacillus sp. CECT 9249]CAH0120663.1 hypothetical protein PAE9249_03184 [Paenibacillus sp. CECT 9249]